MQDKPYCAISVDVDSFDSILKFHGRTRKAGGSYDPVYERSVPRFMELFDEAGIKATFFIVAEDCRHRSKADIVKMINGKGHEVANHSLSHRFAFSRLSISEREDDIKRSGDLIAAACGRAPEGFRAPGYDIDGETVDILERAGYSYDSSLYKFAVYPLARRMCCIKMGVIPAAKAISGLGGEMRDVLLAPAGIYRPRSGAFWKDSPGRGIVEIPVSVAPFIGVPFNTTFMFLAGRKLFDIGLWLTDIGRLGVNYNFHPTDMLDLKNDGITVPHPGIGIDVGRKTDIFRRILGKLSEKHRFLTLREVAGEYKK